MWHCESCLDLYKISLDSSQIYVNLTPTIPNSQTFKQKMLQSTFLKSKNSKEQLMNNNILVQLLPLIVLFAIFYFIIIRPQIKQQKEHKAMVANLKKGDKIVINGGLICEVLKVEDDFFTIKLNDDTTARLAKEFVAYKWEISQDSSEQGAKNAKK